ncbi:glycosyltransferase [Gloeomargarita lithophora]|nr:glycosyltransferase [Gloeomargarita lithophora]
MKFSIVTPCYNAAPYLPETLDSVLNQTAVRSGRVTLEYWLMDGGSTDNTLELLTEYNHPNLHIHSAKDQGMYDALAQGFAQTSGDVIAYVNAGDFYCPHAFAVVSAIMETGQVDWLTGYRVIYNQHSQVIQMDLPYPYRRPLFPYGLYNQAWCRVQQESTFWTQKVHQNLDLETLKSWQYAGDYFLWCQLAKQTELQVVRSYLGGFKRQPGQLSERRDLYHQEVAQMTQPAPLEAKLQQTWDYCRWRWQKNYHRVWRFNSNIDQWCWYK